MGKAGSVGWGHPSGAPDVVVGTRERLGADEREGAGDLVSLTLGAGEVEMDTVGVAVREPRTLGVAMPLEVPWGS